MENTSEQLKRARKVALVLATSTVISILTTIYAVVQKSVAEEKASRVEALTEELERCKQK